MNDLKFSAAAGDSFLTADSSTGVQSTNYIDLEEGGVTDEMMGPMWLTIIARGTPAIGNLTQGIRFALVADDATALNSTPVELVCSGIILPARIVKGFRQSYGFCMAKLHKYLRVWGKAVSTAESTGTSFLMDIFLDDRPITPVTFQKELT